MFTSTNSFSQRTWPEKLLKTNIVARLPGKFEEKKSSNTWINLEKKYLPINLNALRNWACAYVSKLLKYIASFMHNSEIKAMVLTKLCGL